MPVDPVCKIEINETSARATTGQTMHGANEVGSRRRHPQFLQRRVVLFL